MNLRTQIAQRIRQKRTKKYAFIRFHKPFKGVFFVRCFNFAADNGRGLRDGFTYPAVYDYEYGRQCISYNKKGGSRAGVSANGTRIFSVAVQ
jgi:hypothetical protein